MPRSEDYAIPYSALEEKESPVQFPPLQQFIIDRLDPDKELPHDGRQSPPTIKQIRDDLGKLNRFFNGYKPPKWLIDIAKDFLKKSRTIPDIQFVRTMNPKGQARFLQNLPTICNDLLNKIATTIKNLFTQCFETRLLSNGNSTTELQPWLKDLFIEKLGEHHPDLLLKRNFFAAIIEFFTEAICEANKQEESDKIINSYITGLFQCIIFPILINMQQIEDETNIPHITTINASFSYLYEQYKSDVIPNQFENHEESLFALWHTTALSQVVGALEQPKLTTKFSSKPITWTQYLLGITSALALGSGAGAISWFLGYGLYYTIGGAAAGFLVGAPSGIAMSRSCCRRALTSKEMPLLPEHIQDAEETQAPEYLDKLNNIIPQINTALQTTNISGEQLTELENDPANHSLLKKYFDMRNICNTLLGINNFNSLTIRAGDFTDNVLTIFIDHIEKLLPRLEFVYNLLCPADDKALFKARSARDNPRRLSAFTPTEAAQGPLSTGGKGRSFSFWSGSNNMSPTYSDPSKPPLSVPETAEESSSEENSSEYSEAEQAP